MTIFGQTTISTQELIERYHEPLYWHIRRMVVSHDDTEDVLQNTYIQIHTHLRDLKKATSERAWVYRIATNESLMWLRSKHPTLPLDDSDVTPLLDTLHNEIELESTEQLIIQFQQAILTLPNKQRTIFNLRYYEELPYEEIAEITGCTVAAAKANYHIAKEKVSQYMLTHTT